MNNYRLRPQSGTTQCRIEIEVEHHWSVDDAVRRTTTIPTSSPDDDPFEDPVAMAARDAAGAALQCIVFDEHDTFAERAVRQALSDAYLKHDADGVRDVLLEALARGVAVDPEDAVDPDLRAVAIKHAHAARRRRRS